jgi:protein-disulfide isomerase
MKAKVLNALLNLATVGMAVVAIGVIWTRYRTPEAKAASIVPSHVKAWREYARLGTQLGSQQAPVKITVFNDYQCPFCKTLAADMAALQAKWPNDVGVVYREFPLPFHPAARKAAGAALCAGGQHRYLEMHDQLFAHQDSLGLIPWVRLARDAGVPDTQALNICMASEPIARIIARDSADGKRLGVRGTPTLLVNDLSFAGSPGRDSLMAYVTQAIKKAGAQ